ncbi:DUF58 domain-containing protein [Micromonospora endolithica]|uniref:DUF58 domain-containing protein n=1 Tax=Micromonospora endolithica TaxID=230091 RepID=A0A3A9ZQQ2_9ACTN|nr:DUF58 domain-containing protein [Micromonospora endolithica]RKN50503.1 DUF58 domain-containing protein [Micromonospora endolithica]TWJ20801.1 uncharacterized protein DUF58 [Micromonospora endolithica]
MGITARGVGLLVAAVVLLGAGFRFAYPELVLLGAAAATAVGYAGVVAARRPRLVVERVADPDRVARGEPAAMTLSVRNGGRWPVASVVAEDRCGDRAVPVPLLRLRAGRDTTVRYDVPTARRGVVPVGPLRVVRRDPLGLVASARRYGSTVPVWVHPRVHPLSAVPTGAGRSLDGRVDAVPHGSITFDALREYVVGDELRRVHWRTSARVGELMVRENVDTSLPRLVVLLDNRAAAHPERVDGVAESFESACEAAASVVTAAYRADLPVVLLLAVPDDDAGSGEPGGPLDRLAAASLGDADDLRPVVNRLRQDRLGDTLVLLTGPGGRADLGAVGALRGAYPSVVVGVLGATRPVPADAAGLVVVDAADGAGFAGEWDRVRRW